MNISNNQFSESGSLRLEIATLMTSVNKYEPGSAPFKIASISTESGTKKKITSVTTDNKDSIPSKVTVTSGNTITLEIPKELTRYFSSATVKAGTRFIIGFIGGDITTAKLIACFDRY